MASTLTLNWGRRRVRTGISRAAARPDTIDQFAQISPSTIINFYLAMSPPPNTYQSETELALVPKDQDQALESVYVDTFRGISQH